MDFKTNRLGTCKHIEAVGMWIRKHRKLVDRQLPSYTAVYLLYQEGRKICIRIGTEKEDEEQKTATNSGTNKTSSSPQELISQGISFLQGLTETLSSSEKTQALIDTIVREDKAPDRHT